SPQPARAPVGRPACRDRRAVGQFSSDLLDGGPHSRGDASFAPMGRRAVSRLVVVSNRVPDLDSGTPAGGLAVALQGAMERHGGIWMGWSGRSSGAKEPGALRFEDRGRITFALSDLSRRDL